MHDILARLAAQPHLDPAFREVLGRQAAPPAPEPNLLTPAGEPDPEAVAREVEHLLDRGPQFNRERRRPMVEDLVLGMVAEQEARFGKSAAEIRVLDIWSEIRALEYDRSRPLHEIASQQAALHAEREQIEAGRPAWLIYFRGAPVPGAGRYAREDDAWAAINREVEAGAMSEAFARSLAVVRVDPEGAIRGASWESPEGQRQAREAEMGRA